jgi:hypothetical protein
MLFHDDGPDDDLELFAAVTIEEEQQASEGTIITTTWSFQYSSRDT